MNKSLSVVLFWAVDGNPGTLPRVSRAPGTMFTDNITRLSARALFPKFLQTPNVTVGAVFVRCLTSSSDRSPSVDGPRERGWTWSRSTGKTSSGISKLNPYSSVKFQSVLKNLYESLLFTKIFILFTSLNLVLKAKTSSSLNPYQHDFMPKPHQRPETEHSGVTTYY